MDATAARQSLTSEVATRADFSIIRYALCWEDADILLEALDIGPGDVCLSIASAGDNTLSLLSRSPARVIAIDLSPAQLACLHLRVAGFRTLEHADVLALFGIPDTSRSIPLYDRVRPALPDEARAIWDARREALSHGSAGIGRFEHYLALFSKVVSPLAHDRRTVEDAFLPRDRSGRERFFEERWDTARWRLLARLFTSRRMSGWLGRDPSFFRYAEGDVGARTLATFRHAFVDLDPSDNPYLRRILTGSYGTCLPHWLRPENFVPIRANLHRLETCTTSLENYFARLPDRSIDRFNMSDVFEYVSADNADRCFAEIARVGRRGGRLAYWNTFVPRRRPDSLGDRLVRLMDELKDEEIDRALFPHRPLPSGRVRRTDIERTLAGVMLAYVLTSALCGPAFWCALGVLAYLLLMFRLFFMPERLRRSLLLSLATHSPIVPLMDLQGFALSAHAFGRPLYTIGSPTILAFVGMLWAMSESWEVARKTRPPAQETAYVTYSRIMGPRVATFVVLGLQVTAVLVAAALWQALALHWAYPLVATAALAPALAGEVPFLLNPATGPANLGVYARRFGLAFLLAQAIGFLLPLSRP